VVQLLIRRNLERGNLETGRVHPRKHVSNGAVLAASIHRLKHEEHRVPVVRVQLALKLADLTRPLDARSL
jgi:hypothetical protein